MTSLHSSVNARGGFGLFSEAILYLLDNKRLNEGLTGGATTMRHYPVTNIERIEVVRGPGSALYGANAFLATVNIITDKSDRKRFEAALGTILEEGECVEECIFRKIPTTLSLAADGFLDWKLAEKHRFIIGINYGLDTGAEDDDANLELDDNGAPIPFPSLSDAIDGAIRHGCGSSPTGTKTMVTIT